MKTFIPNSGYFRVLAFVFGLMCSAVVTAVAQSITGVSPNSGPVGRTVVISGAGLSSITSVKFNGTTASFTFVSATQQIQATVPAGATSGKISVSNSTTTVQSSSDFTVYVSWIGGGLYGNSWDDGRNWSNGDVPDFETNVMIEGGGSPVVGNSAECKRLDLINSTLTLNQSTSNLLVYGDFTNAGGTYIHTAGTINFAGGNQLVPALDYYNVEISGTGTKQLLGSASINNLTLSGTTNFVATNASTTLTLNGAISGETAARNYIGRLEKTRLVDQTTSSDVFGNIGVHFNNAGNGNWGNVVVTRVTGSAITNPGNPAYHSINRYWDIVPQNPNTNTLVSLTLTWLTTENNNLQFANNKAQAWRSENNGGSWVPVDVPQTISPTTANGERSITVATKTFSKWGISDENNPLPVSWLYFNGKATSNGNLLSWATATEKNADSFIVERSLNGRSFEAIGSVKAAGNSNQVLTYSFTDATPAGEKTYYRLKQTDLDGAFSYSAIIVVSRNTKGRSLDAEVYPNPFAETLNLKLKATDAVSEVKLISLDGKEVYRKAINNAADLTLGNLPSLKPGMYLLQLHGANGITTIKVARQ